MSQGEMKLLGPLDWEESDFWGYTSACRRFSIRPQTLNGVTDYTLWQRGKTGDVIPKSLGTFKTFQEAADFGSCCKLRYDFICALDWTRYYCTKKCTK